MEKHKFTIGEIEEQSGVSRRTIHYYIKEGLIPGSEGSGGGAYYTEVHLLGIKFILKCQNERLKLSEIKEMKKNLSLEQIRKSLQDAEGECEKKQKPDAMSVMDAELKIRENYSFLDSLNRAGSKAPKGKDTYQGPDYFTDLLKTIRRKPESKKETWHRIRVSDGIELNFRDDISQDQIRKIEALLEGAVNKAGKKGGGHGAKS